MPNPPARVFSGRTGLSRAIPALPVAGALGGALVNDRGTLMGTGTAGSFY